MTVTDKEMPIAQEVFASCGDLVELDDLGAYTCEQFEEADHLPFVLVRATDRGNLAIGWDVGHWMHQFRPQAFVLVGTAGGIWRPTDQERTTWKGVKRGHVVVSEYVHFGDYRKVSSAGDLLRHHRLDQPSDHLLNQARQLIAHPEAWRQWLGEKWEGAEPDELPSASEVEIVVGEQIQDNPMDATQQFLMRVFDRAGATEMESVGLAQALHRLRTTATYAPMYLSVRGISDLIWACDTKGPLKEEDLKRAKDFYAKEIVGGSDGEQEAKSAERDLWSPRAAASSSAFALALVQRLVRQSIPAMPGHPAIPKLDLSSVGSSG